MQATAAPYAGRWIFPHHYSSILQMRQAIEQATGTAHGGDWQLSSSQGLPASLPLSPQALQPIIDFAQHFLAQEGQVHAELVNWTSPRLVCAGNLGEAWAGYEQALSVDLTAARAA